MGVGPAGVGLGLEGAVDRFSEVVGDVGARFAGALGAGHHDLEEEIAERLVGVEWGSTDRGVEKDGADGPEIGALVDRVGFALLGAHVVRRADGVARQCEHAGERLARVDRLCHAEVDELHA